MGEEEAETEYLRLSSIPLFRPLPREELDYLFQNSRIWDAPAGTMVLEEGQPSDEFYIILRGSVEIVRTLGDGDESIVGLRLPGEFIGETGLLHQGAARTASARVMEDARLLVIAYRDFSELLKIHPELAYEMASVLSTRLMNGLNRQIQELRAKNEKLQQVYDELKTAQAQIIEKEKLEQSLQVARKIQYQYFTKGEPMPKRSPEIGCGPFGARTLFSGFSKLFRDLLMTPLQKGFLPLLKRGKV